MDTSNPTSYWKNKEDLHTISVRIALAPPVRSRTNTRGVRARCTNRYTKGDGTGYWTRTNKCGVRVRRFTISLIPLAGVEGFEPSNTGVKVLRVTASQYPNIYKTYYFC